MVRPVDLASLEALSLDQLAWEAREISQEHAPRANRAVLAWPRERLDRRTRFSNQMHARNGWLGTSKGFVEAL